MTSIENDYFNILQAERKKLLNLLRSTKLTQRVEDVFHEQIVPFATYAPWASDNDFLEAYEITKDFSLVEKYRCYELWYIAGQLAPMAGDIIEIGVWRG